MRIIRLYRSLPASGDAQVIGKQVLRSGTSVGANYRAACRARSHAEFISRLGTVVEEADETMYWLELLADSKVMSGKLLQPLQNEAKELTAIFTATRQTSKNGRHKLEITN
jgi:four helix bundle protein